MTGNSSEANFLPRFRAGAALILIVAVIMVLASSCGEKTPRDEASHSGASNAEQPAPPAETIEDRLAARPDWLDTADSLSALDFANDPHEFACAVCHGRTEKSDKQWKATCASSECHFRAWPKTVFHRVDLSVFNRCENCHKPHIFSLNGPDCLSCHGSLHTPEGTVTVTGIPGVSTFPHQRHADLSCETCHSTDGKHAALTMTTRNECQSCHHSAERRDDCAQCHTPAEIRGPRTAPFVMRIAGVEKRRKLPFDHEIHEGLDCAGCHEPNTTAAAKISCTDCHDYHHQPEADCARCHQEPPDGAHALGVHEGGCTGSGCHGPQGFPALEFRRNFCESCHGDRSDHFPEKNCVGCHKITASSGKGH